MFSYKVLYSPILLFFILNLACSNGTEEPDSSQAESLYYQALESPVPHEELLFSCAEEMIFPWSGQALILLSRNILKDPDHGGLKKVNRLWSKYVSRHGMEEESLFLRQSLAILDGGPAHELLAPGELTDSVFLTLDKLVRRKTHDLTGLYDYLGENHREWELSFLLTFLGEKGLMGSIDQAIPDWIYLKNYSRERNYSQGYGVLTNLDRSQQVISYGTYYRDSWQILLSHPDRWHIIENWESRADTLGEKARWESFFYAALARRGLSSYRSASEGFNRAVSAARTEEEFDRSLWYRLDSLDKAGETLFSHLIDSAPLWKDPSYFDDLFDREVSRLVYGGDWTKLPGLESTLTQWGSSHMKDRLGWIIARAGERGFLELDPEETVKRYESISQRNEGSWYTMVAQTALSGRVQYFDTLPPMATREKDITMKETLTLRDQLFLGFLERDMPEQARKYYEDYGHDLSFTLLREYAYFLRRKGDYLESIRTVGFMGRRAGYTRSQEDLRLLYPLEYSGIIEYWCQEYGISEQLFQALIKTESGYDSDIVSYAGAIGLSQLMPATAQERLELMGIAYADLTDPDVNISLGTNYMNWLYEREYIENHVKAAAAYNGGPGSVRKWNRDMGYYPEILYMEGIPFLQTRDYVKSLLQGSVIYGYLYGNISPDQTLREMLPETFFNQGDKSP